MSRVVVHIDRLVVSGPADPRAVETAVRDALARELAQPGAVERVVAAGSHGTIDAGRAQGAAGIGAAIGRSIGRTTR